MTVYNALFGRWEGRGNKITKQIKNCKTCKKLTHEREPSYIYSELCWGCWMKTKGYKRWCEVQEYYDDLTLSPKNMRGGLD